MRPPARQRLQLAMTALADGDRSAFDAVYELSWPVLRDIAGRLLRDPAEAEDAAQRALLKLFSHASRFDPKRDALAWMSTFVLNEARSVRNRRRRRPWTALTDALTAREDDSPETALARHEQLQALEQVVGTLAPADRIALGLSPPADGPVRPATLRKRRQRALGRLRLAWKKIHDFA